MRDGLRFVDVDMHVIEPANLFDRYLDDAFKSRVTTAVGKDGESVRASWIIDGKPASMDVELQKYRKARRFGEAMDFRVDTEGPLKLAIERNYDEESQLVAMEREGIDIAVLFPTQGLIIPGREYMDPQLSLAIAQAYNNWIHDFCQYSPDQLRFAALLPVHDVNLACQELERCVKELGAVGSFIRPNLVNAHYWHSNYWDPLYSLHEDLDVAWGFHEGTGAWNTHINALYGENRFYRHVASHWIEMQQAMIAQMIGGVFEFHPNLRVAYLEAQNSWVPGLLSRIGWDYDNYRDTHAPYLTLTPKEYFQRNCWASVEGSEPEMESTARFIGADRMIISTDYPHFDSDFPNVSSNLVKTVPREIARDILLGGASLYKFTEEDFRKADAAAARRKQAAGLAR